MGQLARLKFHRNSKFAVCGFIRGQMESLDRDRASFDIGSTIYRPEAAWATNGSVGIE